MEVTFHDARYLDLEVSGFGLGATELCADLANTRFGPRCIPTQFSVEALLAFNFQPVLSERRDGRGQLGLYGFGPTAFARRLRPPQDSKEVFLRRRKCVLSLLRTLESGPLGGIRGRRTIAGHFEILRVKVLEKY
jgi:hypothetical protein